MNKVDRAVFYQRSLLKCSYEKGEFIYRFSDSLDSKHRENLENVIGEGADWVNVPLAQHLHQTRSVRLEKPLGGGLEAAVVGDDNFLLRVCLRQVHVHLCDRLDTLEN
jgi:hypothetical protein